MMRIKNKKPLSKYAVIAIATIALIAVAAAWWFMDRSEPAAVDNQGEDISNVEPAPAELSEEEAKDKQKFIEEEQNQATKDGERIPHSGDEGSKPLAKVELDATQQGNSVTITSRLTGIGDGTCKLRVTNGGSSYTQQVEVIFQASFSTCAGFSVPVGEVGKGTWNIQVEAVSLDDVKSTGTTSLGVS